MRTEYRIDSWNQILESILGIKYWNQFLESNAMAVLDHFSNILSDHFYQIFLQHFTKYFYPIAVPDNLTYMFSNLFSVVIIL